jgi:hypothetical protein
VSAAQRLDLTWLRLTREQLDELFAMGMELMRGKTVRDLNDPDAGLSPLGAAIQKLNNAGAAV